MPLTVTPDESEERRRRLYGDLAASGDKAMGYGFDALSKMEAMAKDKRATERQATLDNDARAKASADLTLRQASDAREGAREKRDAERDAFDLEQARGKATREGEDRTLTLARNTEDRARVADDSARKEARALLKTIVAAGRAQGLTPTQIAAQAHDNPNLSAITGDEEIEAEWRAQADVEGKSEQEAALRASQIAENEAQAAKAARVPTGASVDPEIAAAKKRKIVADASAAEARAKASGTPDGMTKTTRSSVEKSLVSIGEVKAGAGALRKALSDPRVAAYTGPLSGLENHLTVKVGMQPAEASRVSSLIGQFFDAYKVAVTGAAATDKEMATLMTRMPNIDDNIPNMIAKLDAGDALADARAQYYSGVLQSGSVVPGGATAGTAAADGGEKIRVKRKSDGKTGTIVASDFNPDLYERL